MKPLRRTRSSTGFTLIELGVVLAVLSVLAAVIVPDVIESMHNELGKRVVADMQSLADSARWYYVESANADSPDDAHWPAHRRHADGCALVGGQELQAIMQAEGYLPAGGLPRNPWGRPYTTTVVDPAAGCRLRIATELPAKLNAVFTTGLTQAQCGGNPNICSAEFARPGGMASLKGALDACRQLLDDCNAACAGGP